MSEFIGPAKMHSHNVRPKISSIPTKRFFLLEDLSRKGFNETCYSFVLTNFDWGQPKFLQNQNHRKILMVHTDDQPFLWQIVFCKGYSHLEAAVNLPFVLFSRKSLVKVTFLVKLLDSRWKWCMLYVNAVYKSCYMCWDA